MSLSKSTGTTPSERLLATLCDQTFLGFWSYPNTFRNQGGPKEHCDLMVVYGDHIILFSDKSCAYPNTGDEKLDWSRWCRETIVESGKQLVGAEKRIKNKSCRIYLDNKCLHPFPLALHDIAEPKFHRIIVALGAQERCKQKWGGNGSLHIVPKALTKARPNLKADDVEPFSVGALSEYPGQFHVVDDFTLPLLLRELNTADDFLDYLRFKEALLRSEKVERIAGEENLLAMFLSNFTESGNWQALLDEAKDGDLLGIKDGGWKVLSESEMYQKRKEVLQPSYLWDGIIRQFADHAFAGTLIPGSTETVAGNERMLRCMAEEPRWARGFLALKMYERWTHDSKDRVNYRIAESPTHPKTVYVFVFLPKTSYEAAEYREERQTYLSAYLYLVASKHKEFDRVFGIATEAGEEPYRTFDIAALEGEWSPDIESLANELRTEFDVTGAGHVHKFGEELTAYQMSKEASLIFESNDRIFVGKVGRNQPCPCRSGKKFKRCCGRRTH